VWIALGVALALIVAGAIVFVATRSDPSASAVPPVRELEASVEPGQVSLSWEAPTGEEPISGYAISRNGEDLTTLDDSVTAFDDITVRLGFRYRYEVVALREGTASDPVAVAVRMPDPPVATAILAGDYRVRFTVSAAQGWETIDAGDRSQQTWTFTSNGERLAGSSLGGTWRMSLVRTTLPWFKGTDTAQLSSCSFTPVTDTITVRVRPTAGRMVGGRWMATRFVGTYRDVSPSATAGLYTCGGSSYTAQVEGGLR
jgi:hypothetical protein